MKNIQRRKFIRDVSLVSTGALVGIHHMGRAMGNSPNDSVNIAIIGIRNRGKDHYRALSKIPNVNIAAICDIDQRLLPEAAAEVEMLTGRKPLIETEFRKILENKSIDAVSLATPNHWHALQTIWAC